MNLISRSGFSKDIISCDATHNIHKGGKCWILLLLKPASCRRMLRRRRRSSSCPPSIRALPSSPPSQPSTLSYPNLVVQPSPTHLSYLLSLRCFGNYWNEKQKPWRTINCKEASNGSRTKRASGSSLQPRVARSPTTSLSTKVAFSARDIALW